MNAHELLLVGYFYDIISQRMAIFGGNMKVSFSEIRDGSPIIFILHSGSVHTKMHGNIINLVREDIATISFDTSVSQILKFDHMDIEVIYISDDGHPYVWKKCKIVYFKNNYVLQIKGDGVRYNRRVAYRVSISRSALLRTVNDVEYKTTVKDVSLNGFSIADKKNELHLSLEDGVSIYFEDINHVIDLYGVVTRIEQRDDYVVYGFITRRSCRDLPSYITTKLGDKSNNIPPSYVI